MLTPDDIMGGTYAVLSLFLSDPQFQNQTKERLNSAEATRLVENAMRDRFDTWLAAEPQTARAILDAAILRAEERLARKQEKETKRKSATKKLRLPGKLADCAKNVMEGTEIFIVEGDLAGGSAKQARNRETQAVLPIRGKILNVASATMDKIRANSEISDLCQALGISMGKGFDLADLRYEKVVIMTDADVDGAHIASLLMTLFYTQMRPLIEAGHLYLASPPLYRLSAKAKTVMPAMMPTKMNCWKPNLKAQQRWRSADLRAWAKCCPPNCAKQPCAWTPAIFTAYPKGRRPSRSRADWPGCPTRYPG